MFYIVEDCPQLVRIMFLPIRGIFVLIPTFERLEPLLYEHITLTGLGAACGLEIIKFLSCVAAQTERQPLSPPVSRLKALTLVCPPLNVIPGILSICKNLEYLEIRIFTVLFDENRGAGLEAIWESFRLHTAPKPHHMALFFEYFEEEGPGPPPPSDLFRMNMFSRVTHLKGVLTDIAAWVETSPLPETLTHLSLAIFPCGGIDYQVMVTRLVQRFPSSLRACLFLISIDHDLELKPQFNSVECVWNWIQSDIWSRGLFQLLSNSRPPTTLYRRYIPSSLSKFEVFGKYGEVGNIPQSLLQQPNMWTEVDEAIAKIVEHLPQSHPGR